MAVIPVRLPPKEMTFPLLSTQQGPTVFDGKGDLTYVRGVSAEPKQGVSTTLGYPGVYYAHNVLPSSAGWQSVGFQIKLSASGVTGFFDIEICQGAIIQDNYPVGTSTRTYIAARFNGGNNTTELWYRTPVGAWDTPLISGLGTVLAAPGKVPLTKADVNGVTYIYFPGATSAYVLDAASGTLYSRPFAGLDMSTILGILSSNGYILAWSKKAIAWSSTVDVEDFVPSDVTKAGGGSIQEIRGDIVYCRPVDLGFVVFSDINAAIALFTANAEFPFEFREISGAGGITSQLTVAREDVSGRSYAYTTSGIQAIAQVGTRNDLTFIEDFLTDRVFEDFDVPTLTFTRQRLSVEMGRAVEAVANRYIIISYSTGSTTSFTHAIVVDTLLGRIGKLKITHVGVFPYKDIQGGALQNSRSSMAFLLDTGELKTLTYDPDDPAAAGVMLFGKFQYMRQRWIQIQKVDFENASVVDNFDVYLYPSYDGTKWETPITGTLERPDMTTTKNKSLFFDGAVGKNCSILAIGGFDLSSMVLHFNVHGKW